MRRVDHDGIGPGDEWKAWAETSEARTALRLTDEGNRHHRQVLGSMRTTIEHARRAGEAFLAAKKVIPHGWWGWWVDNFTRASHETVNAYMRIARNWRTIYPRLSGGVLGGPTLTLSAALAILREEKATARAAPAREGERADGAARGPDDPVPTPSMLAELEAAAEDLVRAFRTAIARLDQRTVLFWSKFLAADGLAGFTEEISAELRPVARVVMRAYWGWEKSAESDPAAGHAELEEEFRMTIWWAFKGRTDLTPRQRRWIYDRVKDAEGLRGIPGALDHLCSED